MKSLIIKFIKDNATNKEEKSKKKKGQEEL